MADIFISYSSKDKKHAEMVADKLRIAGADLWIDQAGIGGATRWSTEIAGALESCKAFLLLLSPEAMASPNVIKEATLAAEWGKTIVPIDIEPVQLTKDFAYHLAGLQRVPLHDFDNLITVLRRLKIELKPAKPLSPSPGKQTDKSQRKTLAVLPFEDLSPTRDHEWFSDGLTEELIATLSKLSGLIVTSRTTIREYKNAKLGTKAIGNELGVQYIVEGSVRKAGENLRIAAQLIDVETDSHLWSEVYKGTMADIFEVQESVGREITEALRIALTGKEEEFISKRPTENVEAYELYLQGKDYMLRQTRQSLMYACELFESALLLDPKFALCRAAIARASTVLYYFWDHSSKLLERATEEAGTAIDIDPMLSDAHAALGSVYIEQGKNELALSSAKKAIELEPESAASWYALGYTYYRIGNFLEATKAWEQSKERDPEELSYYWWLVICYHELQDKGNERRISELALPYHERYLRRHPDDQARTINYILFLSYAGRIKDAEEALKHLLERHDLDGRTLYNATCFYIIEKKDLTFAIQVLKRAIRAGWGSLERFENDPDIEPLRALPEFQELLKEVEARAAT